MAKADRETIRALLTDTVTLLCRNSLPFNKQLKVQGLLGITVDGADFYIIQIDEEYGDGGPSGNMERAMPPVARAPMCSIPAKRPRTTIAARTPVRRVAQTVPRRMRGGMSVVSPSSATARQKVRQQLNFPSPQRGMQMQHSAAAASPANAKQMFAMRSPQSPPSRMSASVTPTHTLPVRVAQAPRMPLSQQKPRKIMLMLEEGKTQRMEQPLPPLQRQMPAKPVPKVEKVELFSGGFGQQMPPVKMERGHRDVICVESDEESCEAKKMPDLVPYLGGMQSAMQDTVEDDKTKALQAIMNQALNEARGVSSSHADSYQGDSYQVDSNYISSFQTSSAMYNESVVKKMEPVSSSQLMESDLAYDTSELGGTQFADGFDGGLDMKPFFDQNQLQMSWDASAPPQSMSSPSWHMPPSQSQTPTRSSSGQSVGSPPWMKTENTQVPQKMLMNVMRNKATPLRSQLLPSGSTYSPPQSNSSPAVPSRPTSTASIQQQQQDASGSWKAVTTTKFICNINSCEKEFTTKRAMRHHQKTLHGAIMGGGQSASESPGSASNFNYDSSDM